MISATLWILATVTLASASVRGNTFFDRVLLGLSQEIRDEGFNDLNVNGFDLKINSTGFLNRDFKATFTRGSLLGLSTAARSGECTYTPALDDYIVKCGVVMPFARIAFDAIVKGDDITGRSHDIATTTYLTNVRAEVTVAGNVNSVARFDKLVVTSSGPLETNVVQGKVDLNSKRRQNFIDKLNEALSRRVEEALTQEYSQLLRMVVSRYKP